MNDPSTVTLILTGSGLPEHKRHRREAASGAASDSNSTIYVGGDGCAALFESVFILDQTKAIGGANVVELSIDASKTSMTCTPSLASLTITFTNQSDSTDNIAAAFLTFTNMSRSWIYNSGYVTYTNKPDTTLLTYMGLPYAMETPLTFSFACTKAVFLLTNNDTTLSQTKINFYIDYLQLQAFGTASNSTTAGVTTYTFGNVNYCQGFFSNGIWMAISASAILLTILIVGVTLLLQVTTMDRFDDPKGKPLTIAIEK
jgi:hypothetical protein